MAYESADPVEQLSFKVNGIPMTDFVYPAYFEVFHKAGSVRFDQMKKVNKPFQILSGGYQIIFKNGKWSQIFASVSKKKRFGRERPARSSERNSACVRQGIGCGAPIRKDRPGWSAGSNGGAELLR